MSLSRINRLDRARHRSHSGGGGQWCRRVHRHFGVEHGNRGCQVVVPEQDLLPCCRVAAARCRHHVGCGPCGCRHRNVRHRASGKGMPLDLAARRVANCIARQVAAGRQHDRDCLAGVDRRAAADRHQNIGSAVAEALHAAVDHFDRRVRRSLGENGGKLVAEAGFDLRQHVGARHCRAADDHRATSADAADNFG